VKIIAHRGASAREPENTMAAFALAKALGADSMELDARLCASGQVVVFHDETLERLTDGTGRVAEMPLSRLRELRVKGAHAIPTLEEVLLSSERPQALVIEMKTDRWHETALAAKVAAVVEATHALERGPVVVSSFNPLTLRALRSCAPHLPRAMLAHAKEALPLRALWFAGPVDPRELHLEACMISERTIARARKAGRGIVAWTVNDRTEAERLRALGVDGLITDVPDIFASAASATT